MLKEALLKYADGDLIRINEVNFSLFFDEDHHQGEHHEHHHNGENRLAVPLEQNGAIHNINFKY
jgi:hypothetical protein